MPFSTIAMKLRLAKN